MCGPITEVGSALESGGHTQCYSSEENSSSLSQWLSIANDSVTRNGTLSLVPLLGAGICLAGTCAGLVHIVAVSVSSSVNQHCGVCKMLLPWSHPQPWALTIVSTPLLRRWL